MQQVLNIFMIFFFFFKEPVHPNYKRLYILLPFAVSTHADWICFVLLKALKEVFKVKTLNLNTCGEMVVFINVSK